MTFSPLGDELRSRGVADDEIVRTPRAVDAMEAVLVKRMLTEPEREAALAMHRGAQRDAAANVAKPALSQ
ncbi:hypothetical protein [Paraburkholderia acidiphila]|uniref:Uncharacterized protein n=1 Tax=Paraburkholderia acidiphila TaxID=2571747 RepID=A0A7Z2J8T3_9BURK|nr:hypothetical protein [Paraburkholderia acidiphila]QGZ54953.1 hypothetical protein FAZ97_08465 [Paraburkholderia acidiphila]